MSGLDAEVERLETPPDVPGGELSSTERRVVAVDPITGERGGVEVIALYNRPAGLDRDIDRHRIEFTYNYMNDEQECRLGLTEWDHPLETVSAADMAVLKYVSAYFEHHGLPTTLSLPISEHKLTDFEADATLDIDPDAPDGDGPDADPAQRVEDFPRDFS